MPDITIGRLRGGYCVSWYEGGKRRRYQLEARTRAEAEPEAIDVYRARTKPAGGLTVADLWSMYQDDLGQRATAKTMSYTGRAILPHFGAYRPDQITTELCREYTDRRRQVGKSDGTIWTELGHLSSTLHFGVKKRLTDIAPQIERPRKPDPPERYLTRQEISKLLEATQTPHIKLAILLMLCTAGRVGAILDLTWDRVDFERRQINLRVEGDGRRKGRSIVPINDGLMAALTPAKEVALTDHVVEWNGKRVARISKGFGVAVKAAGLKGVTIHTLRHTAAVHMTEAGIPLEKVSQFLGHSNVQITYRVYARYAPDHLRDAADVLDFSSFKRA